MRQKIGIEVAPGLFTLRFLKAKTEELLYVLLWSAEQLTRPSFRNLTDSYESWAYRHGFLRQIAALEKATLDRT
jgi:hypothetical protein